MRITVTMLLFGHFCWESQHSRSPWTMAWFGHRYKNALYAAAIPGMLSTRAAASPISSRRSHWKLVTCKSMHQTNSHQTTTDTWHWTRYDFSWLVSRPVPQPPCLACLATAGFERMAEWLRAGKGSFFMIANAPERFGARRIACPLLSSLGCCKAKWPSGISKETGGEVHKNERQGGELFFCIFTGIYTSMCKVSVSTCRRSCVYIYIYIYVQSFHMQKTNTPRSSKVLSHHSPFPSPLLRKLSQKTVHSANGLPTSFQVLSNCCQLSTGPYLHATRRMFQEQWCCTTNIWHV